MRHNNKLLKRIEEIAYALEPKDRRNTQFFHVSVIFKKNKVLSIGTNSLKTHPLAKRYGHKGNCVHAELAACIRYGETDCSDVNIGVLRIGRLGNLAMSKPCRSCQKLILDLGFRCVFYTTKEGVWTLLK